MGKKKDIILMRDVNLRKDLNKIFALHLANEIERRINTEYSYRHKDSYSQVYKGKGGYCCIFFYEWSDLNSKPKKFIGKKDFTDFLEKNNIKMDKWQKDWLTVNTTYIFAYATCPKGANELLIEGTMDRLKHSKEVRELMLSSSDKTKKTKDMIGNYPIYY